MIRSREENNARVRAERRAYAKEKEALRQDNKRARAARSPEEQIKRLDWLLGKNMGAVKERARLDKQISERREKGKKVAS